MASRWIDLLLGVFVIFIVGVHHTTGLICYSCFGTGANNECEKPDQFLTAYAAYQKGENKTRLIKECTDPHDQMCYIETYSLHGSVLNHIRDCNRGDTFSFTHADKPERYTRLRDLVTNNETACVWDYASLVCLTKCADDYCNGPIAPESSATFLHSSHLYPILVLWMTLWCNYFI